jgi:hypothetical protein
VTHANNIADERVILRHDKLRKFFAGLFVPDTAIVILHCEHPVEVPTYLVKNVRRGIRRFRNIETYVSDARSYKGNRRGTFSYQQSGRGQSQSGVWIVKAEDVTRARQLLVDAGIIESTRPDSYLPKAPE